ncbi:MAG: putative lipid II flippase FtsW [Spirochaetaceae bacterium]|nr:putative lipid II flippase FtsW [Spirochaetaceae bacterium]
MKIDYIAPEKDPISDGFNFIFVMIVLLLVGLGFTVLYSGSLSYGDRFFDDSLYFVKRQAINLILAIVCFLFCVFIKPETLRKLLPIIVIAGFLIILLPFVPGVGYVRNNAARWIQVWRFRFQPSEFIKIVIVLFLANFFDKKQEQIDEPLIAIFPPFIVCGLFIFFVYLEPDFSTAMFLAFITCVMFFIAGVKLSWFLKGLICFIPIATIMVLSKAYRLKRVLAFLFPENDPLGDSYQVNAAIKAISSGGFLGTGLGNGVQKISSVPEIYSDFIFVVWAEEMGFVGVLIYFLLITAFAFFGFRIALNCKTAFLKYLSFGSVATIIFQSLLNAAVVSRLVPATGIPMPFFSYGGSSLITTMCFCGFILNASKKKYEVSYV